MSDDLRDAFGDDVFLEPDDDEIEEEAGERQNRTFLIAVAVLGGLLFCAIAVFVLWAAVINPRQQEARENGNSEIEATNQAIAATNEAVEIAMAMTATAEAELEVAEPETEEAPEPTATATPVVKPTNTPTSEATGAEEGEEPAQGEEGEATEEAAAEPTATPRVRRTPTPKPPDTESEETASSSDTTPDTGLGEVLLVVVAFLLLGLIVFARRLRKA